MFDNIYVLDGGAYIHKAIFSFQSTLSNIDRWFEPAATTFLRMIIGDLKKVKFCAENSLVILALDGERSWRKDFSDTYKATRKKKREGVESKEWWDEVYGEMNRIVMAVGANTPIHCIKIPRIEADDIGSVCCRYFKDKNITLMSFDADWEQLCFFSNVRLFSPISKKFKKIADPVGILQKKIDKGDVSDEIKGKPRTEEERKIREKIINLINLPQEIEEPIIKELDNIFPKSLKTSNLPISKKLKQSLYKLFT